MLLSDRTKLRVWGWWLKKDQVSEVHEDGNLNQTVSLDCAVKCCKHYFHYSFGSTLLPLPPDKKVRSDLCDIYSHPHVTSVSGGRHCASFLHCMWNQRCCMSQSTWALCLSCSGVRVTTTCTRTSTCYFFPPLFKSDGRNAYSTLAQMLTSC